MKNLRSQVLYLTVAVLLVAVCSGVPGLIRYHISPRGHCGRWVRTDASGLGDATSPGTQESCQSLEVSRISLVRPEPDSARQFSPQRTPAILTSDAWSLPFLVFSLLYLSRSSLDPDFFSFRVAPARAPPVFAI